MSTNLSRRNTAVAELADALGYRGRLIRLGQTYGHSDITLGGTYWDGGSRTTWHAYDFQSHSLVPLPQNDPVEYGGAPAHTVHLDRLPDGVVIVAHDIVCGKDRGLRLFPATEAAPSVLGSRGQLQIGAPTPVLS
jgi:hypothetical protein